jgi:FkbH-like protein
MYETEANYTIDPGHEIPASVAAQFGELSGSIRGRTILPWGEHCTECAWPACYTSCDFYTPREDARCRRFAEGMVRVECPSAINTYLLKITFKRWAKLWAVGTTRLHSAPEALTQESADYRIGRLLHQIPLPKSMRAGVTQRRYRWKKWRATRGRWQGELPTEFICECYNPSAQSLDLSLTIRSANELVGFAFQTLIHLKPGFNRAAIAVDDISRLVDLHHPFNVELTPNEVPEFTTLYFGLIDFVHQAPTGAGTERKIKCVVWDLDNTIWNGVLVEDGLDGLALRQGIADLLRELDERGILNSVASKNHHDEAMDALRHFQIDQYFLCPQISWRPKSQAIAAIAQQLNIGIDSLLFVDDSHFELDEVRSVLPDVRTLDALLYDTLLSRDGCNVPVTDEGRNRRRMYQVDLKRQEEAERCGGDYLEFLRTCQIRLTLHPMTADNLERVYELTQRTNQMNFSGVRYERDMLVSILDCQNLATDVLSCEDRFGSYGVIGFSIVDTREPRMTDLMFSCRIQSKRIEHAFLGYIIRRYVTATGRDFFANYRKTKRNAPTGRVFQDLGMEELTTSEGVTSLVFRKDLTIADDAIIAIVDWAVPASAAQE